MKILSGFFDEILTIVYDQLSISRRLIESEFLKRNRAEERFTMMGMFTSPAHFTIWDRLGAIFKQDVSKVNSVQEACTKCFAVHILESCKPHEKKNYQKAWFIVEKLKTKSEFF